MKTKIILLSGLLVAMLTVASFKWNNGSHHPEFKGPERFKKHGKRNKQEENLHADQPHKLELVRCLSFI